MNADAPVVRSELRGAIALVTIDNPPVNAASLALMAAVTWFLLRAAIVNPTAAGIAVVAVLLVAIGVNAAWIVGAGALAGWWLF